jgi:hypothetical protein
MKPSRFTIALFDLMICSQCLLSSCASSEKMDPTSSFQFRSPSEKQETEYKAQHGDPKSARRMAEYCYFVEGSKTKAIHWYKIGASYGDKVAKDNVKQLSEE